MDITFATPRSGFLKICEDVIYSGRKELEVGGIVRIKFDKRGGYPGRIKVTIRPNDTVSFETNWEGNDPTRFPARIKAAATALLNCECLGCYEITHRNGTMEIQIPLVAGKSS